MATTVATESKTQKVGVAVTPTEKRRVGFMVEYLNAGSESELLRERSLADVLAEYERFIEELRRTNPALADTLERVGGDG
jgi:hypothetical protein